MHAHVAATLGAVWLVVILCFPTRAVAQEGRRSAALTMERTVALALERALPLRAAEAGIAHARGRLEGARVISRFNPELSAGAGVRFGRDGTTPEVEGGISQTFELGGARARRIAAAEAGLAASTGRREAAVLRVASATRESYVEAVASAKLLRIAEEGEALARSLHQAAADRGAADAATDLEVNLAVIEWAGARRTVASARRRNIEARLELGRLLALSPGEDVSLPGELPPCLTVSSTLGQLLAAARERGDLDALRRQVEMAEAEVAVARAEAWPDLEVSATYSLEEGRDHIAAVGLAIPLPLFARNQGEIAQARSAAELARIDLESAELAVERDVAGALASYQAAVEAAGILDESVLGRVEQNLELLELSLAEGSVGIVEVLLVQRELLAARREAIESNAAVHGARVRLELAVGGEVE